MIDIGTVTIPIVASFQEGEESEVDEFANLNSWKKDVDNTVVKHEPSVDSVTITGFTNEELHPDGLSLEEQKEEIKKLRRRRALDNPIDYKHYYGYLLIEDIDFTDNADSKIVDEVEIVARYLPWPKYNTSLEPMYLSETTGFGSTQFGRHFGR